MDEMPDLQVDILTVTLDRVTGKVEVDFQGLNYLEAIGILTVALNQVQDEPFALEYESENDEDL